MNPKGHKVALSGSYSGNIQKLLNNLQSTGVLQFSSLGREITLQVKSENLEKAMEALRKQGVGNLSVLEWRKYGVTIAGSGAGTDDEELVKVSLIPANLDEGVKSLAAIADFDLSEEFIYEVDDRIKGILEDAGVTDTLYTVQFKKQEKGDYLKASEVATLNALFEAGGLINIE